MGALRSVLILLSCCLAAGTSIAPPEPSCHEERERVQVLARGTIDEVWAMFDSEERPDFSAIGLPNGEALRDCRDALLTSLTRAVTRTDDARIAARCLDEIDFQAFRTWEPVVRAGLAHASPSARRHAARAADRAADAMFAAAVEERFQIERDPGVRRDLMKALASTGSRKFLPELREIARTADPIDRIVALDAVLSLPDRDSIDLLESMVMNDEPRDADAISEIVNRLASWKDVPEARAALVRIGRSGPDGAAAHVIRVLGSRPGGDLTALTEIANARSGDDDASLRGAALGAIAFMTSEKNFTSFSCGAAVGVGKYRGLPLATGNWSEFQDREFFVVPREGGTSARCWDAPGFMWPHDIRPRVPTGTSLYVVDEFSWQGDTWFSVLDPEFHCWMPEYDLSNEDPAAPEDEASLDVDVTTQDAISWSARSLAMRGWLTWLDSTDETVGLRLDAIPDRETIVELVRIRRLSDSPAIALAIDRWLYANADWLEDDEDLGSAIPDEDPRWLEESEDEPTEP